MRTECAFLAMTAWCLGIVACGDRPGDVPGEEQLSAMPSVLTSFYPTTYFAERIVGDVVRVDCPLPEDEDPIFWMPDAAAIQAFQGADLIVLNGAEFEKWVDKVSLPEARVVSTAAPFEAQWVRYEEAVMHRHGPEGEHSHEGVDGHTWVDPNNALAQSQAMTKAFSERWPEHASVFEQGLASLEKDLMDLDRRWKAFAERWGERPLLASHPAYNYLVQRYGLRLKNLDLDPSDVGDADLQEIAAEVQQLDAKVILWEGQPSPEVEAKMTALGLQSVLVSPCEGTPESDDYLDSMRSNLDRLDALLAE